MHKFSIPGSFCMGFSLVADCVDFTFLVLGCVIFSLVGSVCVKRPSPVHTVVTSSVGFSCVSSCLPVPGLVAVIFHLAYSSSGMSTIFLLCFILKKVFSVQVMLP